MCVFLWLTRLDDQQNQRTNLHCSFYFMSKTVLNTIRWRFNNFFFVFFRTFWILNIVLKWNNINYVLNVMKQASMRFKSRFGLLLWHFNFKIETNKKKNYKQIQSMNTTSLTLIPQNVSVNVLLIILYAAVRCTINI